jgi:hypothetical protein
MFPRPRLILAQFCGHGDHRGISPSRGTNTTVISSRYTYSRVAYKNVHDDVGVKGTVIQDFENLKQNRE